MAVRSVIKRLGLLGQKEVRDLLFCETPWGRGRGRTGKDGGQSRVALICRTVGKGSKPFLVIFVVGESKETAFVLLGRAIFRHVEALAMNTFIVKRDYEATFLKRMYADYQTGSYELVAVCTFRLEHFPSHNVSIVLYRVKPRGEIQDDI